MKAERAQDIASRERARTQNPAGAADEDRQQAAEPKQADEQPEKALNASEIRAREAAIDAAVEMTFPASDPPSWSP